MKPLLWWLIAGTKGGINRAYILRALKDRPYNANQLSELLKLDYKTVRHHLKVLLDNNIIVTSGESEKYGAMYFLSKATEENYKIFEEIWEKIGKK
ncbi:MAG: winged helix-turn-helix domain-containing protein [Candidatus Thermoplasmatota archaeon]|nr:winged helix-turn-helix domain-containing protein [Candidatus Thermoplasmatota archaeon]